MSNNKASLQIKLKIDELTAKDETGRGVVRIDSSLMRKMDVREGDIISVQGNRMTAVMCVRSLPKDVGLNIIRMDNITRRNCRSEIGDLVNVGKPYINRAKYVKLAPAEKGLIIHISPSVIKKNFFIRPVVKGDLISPSPIAQKQSEDYKRKGGIFEEFFGVEFDDFFDSTSFSNGMKFLVLDTEPKGIVVIGDETNLEIIPEYTGQMLPVREDDIPESRILNVDTKPDIQKMIKLKDLAEVLKLSKNFYINKFKDENETIYFVENEWYFKISKKIKNK